MKTTKFLGVVGIMLLSGCASIHNREAWTDSERIAFSASIAGHGIDLASSVMSDGRCAEKHIFLDDNPSNAQLVGIKVVAVALEYWIYNSPKIDSTYTPWYGATSAILHGIAGISNFQNDCY